MKEEIFIAGAGGQGIISLGKIIALSAVEEDKQVTTYASYGAEIRGGTANCTVVISDTEISSPVVRNPGTMIIMNSQSLEKYLNRLKNNGLLLINSSFIQSDNIPSQYRVVKTPASEIADRAGNMQCANIVLLGAYISASKILNEENVITGIKKYFETKPKVIDLNIRAFKEGFSK